MERYCQKSSGNSMVGGAGITKYTSPRGTTLVAGKYETLSNAPAVRLQVSALDERPDLSVTGEGLAVGLEAEAGRVLDGEVVVELEVDPPELNAVQVLGDGLGAIHIDLSRVRASRVVDVIGVAD